MKSSSFLQNFFGGVAKFYKRHGLLKIGGGAVVLILLIAVALHFINAAPTDVTQLDQTPSVTVASAGSLSANVSPLSIAGVVNSLSEASVRADVGGQITHVYSALGNYVSAGTVLAEVDNASQRAAVAQAQGAVDAANAGASVSQTSLTAAQQNAVAGLLSAYSAVDKSVHSDTDPMFSNPQGPNPQLGVPSSDSQAKINAENLRSGLNGILARESSQATTLSAGGDLTAEITQEQADLRAVRDYLDMLIRALNSGIAANGVTQATISADMATANGSRTAITGAISALVAAQQAIDTAQKNSTGGSTGTSASQASLAQAEAGLAAARANLEKTLVRAPISGTVNTFSLKVGDYLSAGTVAAVIANNGALEVVTYVTENDSREISVGSKAKLQGTVDGVVTRIAPAIDPSTKKIDVRIGITGKSSLINGQSVTIELARTTNVATKSSNRLIIPLAALKIGASDMSVFTVASSSVLEAHPVQIGELLGDRVVITSGITADTMIVTDARGLRAGETVIVKYLSSYDFLLEVFYREAPVYPHDYRCGNALGTCRCAHDHQRVGARGVHPRGHRLYRATWRLV